MTFGTHLVSVEKIRNADTDSIADIAMILSWSFLSSSFWVSTTLCVTTLDSDHFSSFRHNRSRSREMCLAAFTVANF